MKKTTGTIICLGMVFAMLLHPGLVLAAPPAQDRTVDDATVAAIQSGAAAVYGVFGGGGPAVIPPLDDTPDDEPTPTPEPTGEVEIGEFVEYSSSELTVSFPENWEIIEGGDGSFEAIDIATNLSLQLENFSEDVPGLFMLPIFEGQAGLFAQTLGEGAEIGESTRLTVGEDALPALRMTFTGVSDPFAGSMDGVVYIIAAGRDGYGLYAGAERKAWQTIGPVVDEIVSGIRVNPEYITLQHAVDESLTVTSEDGAYEATIPPGWYGSITGDEDLGIVIADPDIAIVGAAGLSPETESSDPMLRALVEGIAGILDEETSALLVEAILENMDLGDEGAVEIDDTQTKVFPSMAEGVFGTIRIVGDAPIDEGIILPVTVYISVFGDRAGVLVVFGEPDEVQALESDLLTVVESLRAVE